jgi:hypothetical protein
MEWLEDLENGPSDIDVWGAVQTSYGFNDLFKEKDRRQQHNKGKGKAVKKDKDNVGEGSKKKKKKKRST